MDRSRLILAVASVFAGTTAVLVIAGLVSNPLFLVFAIPFGAAAYLLWADLTGRIPRRFRSRRIHRGGATRHGRRRSGPVGTPDGAQSRAAARRILGVGPEADEAAIRRAYREKVKATHPDADGGDEDAFKRVTAAYDRLRD